ncbi:hypothetical protein AEQU_0431 [Adlercreutzia equolifaciens DSM 19450]|nr:hypothetical protein DX903_01915 [Adlercreutzia equolifaciens]BAN76400.1 hypothetical protein AEQU_0431 [Adlercreutzia equolifaciens DSM 19450]
MGAFGSRDSLLGDAADPATLNRYAYAGGNPVASCDPTGHVTAYKNRVSRQRATQRRVQASGSRRTTSAKKTSVFAKVSTAVARFAGPLVKAPPLKKMTKELSYATNRTFNRLPPAPAASVVAVGAGAALRSVYYGSGKGGGGPGSYSPGTARTVALTASAIRARNYAAAARAAFCGTAAHMGESKTQGVDLAAIGHGALDLLGFIPGIGAAADVANGLWYAAEGNYVDAAMSFVSAIPGVGDAAGAAKVGAKAGLAALDAADAAMAATRAAKKLEAVKLGGGAYKDVRTAGREAHHMPAKSVSHLGEREGPAISMTPEDHRLTASWGNSKAAQDYRKEQQRLVDEGRFREAQQQDIDHVRKIAGDKYDREISQMIAYTDELERKGRI